MDYNSLKKQFPTEFSKKQEDEKVQKMIEEWDIVKCQICGKKISMLSARMLQGSDGFVCKGDCK